MRTVPASGEVGGRERTRVAAEHLHAQEPAIDGRQRRAEQRAILGKVPLKLDQAPDGAGLGLQAANMPARAQPLVESGAAERLVGIERQEGEIIAGRLGRQPGDHEPLDMVGVARTGGERKAGVDPQRLFDVLSTSGGRSHHFLKCFPSVLAGDFAPRFGIALSRKDLSLAMALAARLEMPMLVTATVRQVYEAAHAQGLGDLDMAGVTRLYEQWTGVSVRGKPGSAGA